VNWLLLTGQTFSNMTVYVQELEQEDSHGVKISAATNIEKADYI